MARENRRRRQVGGSAGKYKKFTTFEEGDYLVGKYIKQGVDSKFGKPTYTFELESFELTKPTFDHPAGEEIEEGAELTLNSTGTLDSRMKEVQINDVVEIIYQGKAPLPVGHPFAGTQAHQFEVYVCGEDEGTPEEDGAEDL